MKYLLILLFIISSVESKSITDTTRYKLSINDFTPHSVSGQIFLESVISINRQFNGDNHLTFHFPDISFQKKYDIIIQIFDYDTHVCIGMEKIVNVTNGTTVYIKYGHWIVGIEQDNNYYYIELK